MYVIVKNLLPSTTIDEFEQFVLPAAKHRFYEKKGIIKALKIIDLVNRKGLTIERHGLIRVNSDALEKRLIKSLNGKPMGDAKVSVNNYTIRHWSIDRRQLGDLPLLSARSNLAPDRRVADRRRKDLKMVPISERIFSTQFAKPAFA